MVTDAQYARWLRSPSKFAEVLIEADYLEAGVPGTVYVSQFGYTSQPDAITANKAYVEVLSDEPYIRDRMSEALWGRSTVAKGEIKCFNPAGRFDMWLNYHWSGQAVRIYLGDPSWHRDDFRLVLTGVNAGLKASNDELVFSLRDKSDLLNKAFTRTQINDEYSPLAFGNCFNVTPLLIDSINRIYKVHDGQVNAISDVRVNGVTVTYTPDLVNGEFQLAVPAAGQVTCDVQGAVVGGTYLTKAIDITREILITYGGIASGDIDETSMAALLAAASYDANLYITGDRKKIITAIDELIGKEGLGGFWAFDALGKFTVGRLEEIAGSHTNRLSADDIEEDGLTVRRQYLAQQSVKLGYQRNWTVQKEGLAGSVLEADRKRFGDEYLLATAADLTVINSHPDAEHGAEINSLLVSQADAVAEAARRLAIVSTPRFIFEARGFSAPVSFKKGEEIRVTYPGYGFSAGSNVRVVGLTTYYGSAETVTEVWR